ncbi:MAG: BREX system ATP-binding domain-containing protein [bacterium]
MRFERKGESPFHPGQPVPVDLFVGRQNEIDRINRAAGQVVYGKPQAVYIMGEYGIGKTSLARLVRVMAEADAGLCGFHVMLGEKNSLDGLAMATVEAILQSDAVRQSTSSKIRDFVSMYIGEQTLFGMTLRLDKLKKDAPSIQQGFLPFLRSIHQSLGLRYKGLILILDEINGIASQPEFALFLKRLVDENAVSGAPVPLLLIVCGTQERYGEIVKHHRPVERIFDIALIEAMSQEERSSFFDKAFQKVNMQVDKEAMPILCDFSGGLPRLMHLLGDNAFWISQQNIVDESTARKAVIASAEEVGRKFVDQQVYKDLRSENYRSILKKLALFDFSLEFKKSDIAKQLNEEEKKKFNNFLQRMKKLDVLGPGKNRGEYKFRESLTRLYIYMKSIDE